MPSGPRTVPVVGQADRQPQRAAVGQAHVRPGQRRAAGWVASDDAVEGVAQLRGGLDIEVEPRAAALEPRFPLGAWLVPLVVFR